MAGQTWSTAPGLALHGSAAQRLQLRGGLSRLHGSHECAVAAELRRSVRVVRVCHGVVMLWPPVRLDHQLIFSAVGSKFVLTGETTL